MSSPLFPRVGLLVGLAMAAPAVASAYDLIGSTWPDGDIVMHLQLGQPTSPLLDGSTDWNVIAESALNDWNANMSRSRFVAVRDSTAAIARGNRLNNVAFRPDVYGMAFGTNVLAVTLGTTNTSTNRSTEKDVLFNSVFTWNSYRGSLRSGQREFRRVALHEFGHVLGLDHPDQAVPAQSVDAVMNSIVGNTESLTADDRAGAQVLYFTGGSGGTPSIAASPQSRTVRVGESYTMGVAVNGTGPFSYVWTFRAANSSTSEIFRLATGPSYSIGSVQNADAGTYSVSVTGPGGSVTSGAATLTVTPIATSPDTTLANISTRGVVGTDSGVLIAGLVIGGLTSKNVLIRAAGPALGDFNVGGFLADPLLKIVNDAGLVVAQNDNWESSGSSSIVAANDRVGAFQFKTGSRDAALLLELPPGNYTAIVSGVNATSGVALVEAYDADANAVTSRTRKLINIATRGQVSAGENALIAGLVVAGPSPRTYLIRAVGPTLANAPYNVTGVLSDPFLQIYQGENLLRENDDWDSPLSAQSALRDAATRVGAFPLQVRRDAAMIVTLQPGNYTAKVSGFQGSSGVALVEIYELP